MEIVFRKEVQCEGKMFYDSELKAQRAAHGLSKHKKGKRKVCLLYTSPSPRDLSTSRMPSSA